jgi:glutamate-1-semialdehyde aminotransferase
LREHGDIISGTYSGDTVALVAVQAVLDAYRSADVIAWLWARGQQLQDGLRAVCAPWAWVYPEGRPVHQRLVFDTEDRGHAFSAEMVKRGIIWAPFCANLMRAHTEGDIARVVDAATESLAVLARERVA